MASIRNKNLKKMSSADVLSAVMESRAPTTHVEDDDGVSSEESPVLENERSSPRVEAHDCGTEETPFVENDAHLWSEVCNKTGTCESSPLAQRVVIAHIWQFQKKLFESQKESASSLKELQASKPSTSQRMKATVTKASPYVSKLVHRGYKYYMECESMSAWNIDVDPLGGSNKELSLKIMEYVRSASASAADEEVNAAIKTYWRNIRRLKKEESTWGKRQVEARRKKNKRDKCKRRLEAVERVTITEDEKEKFKSVFITLPIELTQSSEESGEEDDPFNDGEKVQVKFVRRRRWESKKFKEQKKLCDQLHRAKTSRSCVQRVNGAFSSCEKPDVMPEFSWILQD